MTPSYKLENVSYSDIILTALALIISAFWIFLWWLDSKLLTWLRHPPQARFGLISVSEPPLGEGNRPAVDSNSSRRKRMLSNNPGVNIIWVHGLGSNPGTTWMGSPESGSGTSLENAGKNINWIDRFLLPDLNKSTRTDVQMIFYNYESYWHRDSLKQRLSRMAEDMLWHIYAHRELTAGVRIPMLVLVVGLF